MKVTINPFVRTLVLFLLVPVLLSGQDLSGKVNLTWTEVQRLEVADGVFEYHISFNDASHNKEYADIPVYYHREPIPSGYAIDEVLIEDLVYEELDNNIQRVSGAGKLTTEMPVKSWVSYENKRPYGLFSFAPFRVNPNTGRTEKLVSFSYRILTSPGATQSLGRRASYAANSVLASGNWKKIAVTRTGLHRISYQDLQNFGLDPASIDPRNIRIYGNGGGMLPESLAGFRHDDLVENAIVVVGENDGRFDAGDYILFYGESPHDWIYNSQTGRFSHRYNIYSEETYYFITADLGPGKRVSEQSAATGTPTNIATRFIDYAFHEQDLHNLANTGRVWYGEVFDIQTTQNFLFSFPNVDMTREAYLRAYVAAKSSVSSNFRFSANNNLVMLGTVPGIPSTSETYARTWTGGEIFTPNGPDITIKLEYLKTSPNAIGWLNYMELNVTRNLQMAGNQLNFRAPDLAGPGNTTEFRLGNAGGNITIWNVTDPTNPRKVIPELTGGQAIFTINHDSLTELMAFSGTDYYSPVFVENVANQNLHGIGPHDMVIITHPDFMSEALRLANHHRDKDGLEVFITEPQEVYNEFSSGAQDISAIRDFMKMLYDQSTPGRQIDYLLLFGDASFDYKDRIANNSNFVPTWEDDESLTIVYSIATDDFYGFLDGPGDDLLDIGIGRLPVETQEQAIKAVDKVLDYASNADHVMGEWRNSLCFVADDEDGNLHINQAEQMAIRLDTTYGIFNIDKIYVDAFPQIITPGGQRAPEVNEAINNRIKRGTLLMNYTGHGGEVGWAHERILELSDINSWSNLSNLPIFITATCEFSRYDDPERVSAGEQVFRHPDGGSIAMFTTARATFGGSNFNLNQALFDFMFEKLDGEYPRFGDLVKLAKNKNGVADNDKKFILLGDPALKLAYPNYSVHTTEINGNPTGNEADTLKALSQITVKGEIRDENGNKMTSYNGLIYSKVFDKPAIIRTLATDPGSYEKDFALQKNILYKGKSEVRDGMFSFSFIVPKDIAYNFGKGKISYYSFKSGEDARGYFDGIIIGGFDTTAPADDEGPALRLYMNDESFAFGGITNENPLILAHVEDESGINTVGNGIGHDIVAVLNENTNKPIVLNEYYEAELNSFKKGTVKYPLSSLENGRHSLSLKVWDVYNNSSQEYTEFIVAEEAQLAIEQVLNYPNPFTTRTEFFFNHNQPGNSLEVQVQIFTVSGKLIKTIDALVLSDGFRSEPIPWDGKDDFGDRIGRGVYLYKVRVRTPQGEYAEKLEKLVILR